MNNIAKYLTYSAVSEVHVFHYSLAGSVQIVFDWIKLLVQSLFHHFRFFSFSARDSARQGLGKRKFASLEAADQLGLCITNAPEYGVPQ